MIQMPPIAESTVAPARTPHATRPLRVLHVGAGNLYGGIETLLVTLAHERGLGPAMEPQFAVCFEGRLACTLRAHGVYVHALGSVRVSRPWQLVRARRRLHALIEAQAIDVVVTNGCWPHVLAAPAARRARRPLVFWAHDIPSGGHWLQWWARQWRPDLVVANSHATRQAAQAHLFPRCPDTVMYYPVAPPAASSGAVQSDMRAAVGSADDAVVIVTACRLDRYKGHTVLVEALGQLRGVAGWDAWIAGGVQRRTEQRYLAELQARTQALGVSNRVHFLGQRTDVPRLLAAADIHCQANTGPEPFGIAFVEALYAGLPVVTSALGGALEIVDATCGLLVPAGDAARLAQALCALIEDRQRRRQLGAGGPARAALLCDPAMRMRQLGEILSGVCQPAHTAATRP
jgi:glycosyltransferase involved in cell wall biosynthesis